MRYVSTRGQAPTLAFDDVVLAGLARDGGLYVPEQWPSLDITALSGLPYQVLAARVMAAFAEPAFTEDELQALTSDAYADFDSPEPAPLIPLVDGIHLLELFHGPTLAFKDYALQVLGRLFDRVLSRRGARITIIGATSGDTGSAAIEACRDRSAIEVFILHPHGRVSAVQRRQMTTVQSPNVHNIAIDGTFDDCQDLVKAMFNDAAFRDRLQLSAINSINWARICAQVVYYVYVALALGRVGRPVDIAVPTGNFGNIFAGWVARAMGAPIGRLVCASNSNDILTRFFHSGRLDIQAVVPTLSPSMDIQVSSNLERLLFEIYARDGNAVAELLTTFREQGKAAVDQDRFAALSEIFGATRVADEETTATIANVYRRTDMIIDPHTAIGVTAALDFRRDNPMVAIATAHAAKFPDAVEAAIGIRPQLPSRLADLFDRPERYAVMPADLPTIQRYVDRLCAERSMS